MARRLRNLGGVELFNAVLLPAVFLYHLGPTAGGVAAWVAVDSVLVIGAAYWFARARRADLGLDRTPGLRAFRVARTVLIAVLAVTLAVVVVDLVAHGGAARWVWVAVWLFAVAELVNYFHLQLSYQTRADLRRLRRRGRLAPAHLGVELGSGRR